MKLTELLRHIGLQTDALDIGFQGAVLDSRQVQPGNLFLAIPGQKSDGRQYIADAIQKGAIAVLSEQPVEGGADVPIFTVPALSQKLRLVAEFSYPQATQQALVAVTGTNGKTSIVQWLAEVLMQQGQRCGTIGTLGTGFPGQLDEGNLTTPDILALYRTLQEFQTQNTSVVAMEVSSIALQQKRVDGLAFETAIFSNFSADHLDYHGDMDAYWQAKESLFKDYPIKQCVLNLDDCKSHALLPKIQHLYPCYGFSVKADDSDNPALSIPTIRAVEYELSSQGMRAKVISPWGEGCLHSKLFGLFNLSNLLSVIATACLQGVPFDKALQAVEALTPIPGRMQVLRGGPHLPKVIIDYAHTPDALEQLLAALTRHCKGKLICVFGCGGDRDRLKRPVMREVAEEYADEVVVTADNPRHEAVDSIIQDMLKGQKTQKIAVVEDRRQAIEHAILNAAEDDIVVLAGKGHEKYQLIGDTKYPFCDLDVASMVLSARDPICEL